MRRAYAAWRETHQPYVLSIIETALVQVEMTV